MAGITVLPHRRATLPEDVLSKADIPFGLAAAGLDPAQAREWLTLHRERTERYRTASEALLRTWEAFRARYARIDPKDPRKGWVRKGAAVRESVSPGMVLIADRGPEAVLSLAHGIGRLGSVVLPGLSFSGLLERLAALPRRAFAERTGLATPDWLRKIQSIAGPALAEGVVYDGWNLPSRVVVGQTDTGGHDGHAHRFVFDPDSGLGMTDESGNGGDWYGHVHGITDGVVQPGGMDGHTHAFRVSDLVSPPVGDMTADLHAQDPQDAGLDLEPIGERIARVVQEALQW